MLEGNLQRCDEQNVAEHEDQLLKRITPASSLRALINRSMNATLVADKEIRAIDERLKALSAKRISIENSAVAERPRAGSGFGMGGAQAQGTEIEKGSRNWSRLRDNRWNFDTKLRHFNAGFADSRKDLYLRGSNCGFEPRSGGVNASVGGHGETTGSKTGSHLRKNDQHSFANTKKTGRSLYSESLNKQKNI